MEYHPWATETHHGPNPLTHIRTVAVDRTLVTLSLGVPEPAAVQSREGIIQQVPALIAQLRRAVVLPAPQLNHMPNRPLLPIDTSHN